MGKILVSFTAGIILGLLYAPAKGADTRKKIANIGNDLQDGWNNITDQLTDKIDSFREGVDTMADNAAMKIERTQFETGR